MADIESNIRIDIDTSSALASIKALQSQISQFQKEMSAASASTAANARNLQRQLISDINATGQFSAGFRTIRSSAESFTNALEKNKLSMGEYFRFGASQVRGFRNVFSSEFNTIEKVARERVKTLQTQYVSLGRDANGALQSIAVRPLSLNMNDLGTRTAMAAQQQQIFNQLLTQGSTNLLNFGKNTQWAGRQLMVGFTIPLSIFGSMASQTFMQLEEQAIRFRRVYGELFTPAAETDQMIDQIKELASEFTKYGIAVESTLGLAADAAQMGLTGAALIAQTTEATRLAVLGGVDQQQALETTISLQNALGISTEDLAESIDFLNAVENQTVTAIEDLTIAIPKAAPVIKQLGGDVRDLAFFLTAMKEGGINASEGANALKSGLASLINPTQVASDMLLGYGINIKALVEANRGDVSGLVVDFARALDQLNPLQRARAIEQLFGKFQFARISTLFQNVIKEGTQAQRVLELANATTSELAQLSSRELQRVEESTTFRFRKAVEDFQAAIAPVGEEFLKLITPLIEIGTKVLEQFNKMSDGAKGFVTGLTVLLGAILPVFLMTFGLIANGVANIIKGFVAVRNVFLNLRDGSTTLGQQIEYMTQEQLEAASVAASLDQTHSKLTQTFTSETSAIKNLISAYERMVVSQAKLMGAAIPTNIGRGKAAPKLAGGGIVKGPGTGTSDSIVAMISNGEAVIPADAVKKNPGIIKLLLSGEDIPGFAKGLDPARAHVAMPFSRNSEQFSAGIEMAGIQKLAAQFPQFVKVVSNLVAELPQRINIALVKGLDQSQFVKAWEGRQGKMLSSAKLGGLDISSKENIDAVNLLEQEIKNTAIQIADSTQDKKVNDEILAKATRAVIDANMQAEGAIGKAAMAFDKASKQIGQVRIQAPTADIRSGLESGTFTRGNAGRVLFEGTEIARESQSKPGKFRPASSYNPAKSYSRQVIMSVEQGAIDGINEAAKSKSPSRRAKQAGKNIADGAIQGIEEGAKKARSAGAKVTSQSQSQSVAAQQVTTTDRLTRMNNALQTAVFGITSVAGAMTMFGGKIGEIGGVIFQLSGIFFALMQVTQLLTQASFLRLVADRKAIASQAMAFASYGKGIAASSGFAGSLARGAIGIAKFLGPVGMVVAGLTALGGIIGLIIGEQQKQKDAINGLGNAAFLTAEKMKAAGNLLGFTPQTTPFAESVVAGTAASRTAEEATLVENVRASDQFKQDFKVQIEAIRNATQKEAEMALSSVANQLFAAGATQEQVDAFVRAIAQEAERTDLSFNFASIDFSKQGKDQIVKAAREAAATFSEVYAKGLGAENQKVAKASVATFASSFEALRNGFKNGLLSAEQFDAGLLDVTNSLTSLSEQELGFVLPNLYDSLGLTETMDGVKSLADQMLILQAAASGIEITPEILEALRGDGEGDAKTRAAVKARKDLGKAIKEEAKAQEAVNVATEEKNMLDEAYSAGLVDIQQQTTNLKNQRLAYEALTAAGYDTATAFELAGNAILAASVASALTAEDSAAKMAELKGDIDAFLAERALQPRGAGGAGAKSPFQEAIDSLREQRKELNETNLAYAKLRKQGIGISEAFELAKDPVLATAIATTKVGTKKWADLLKLIKEVDALARKNAVRDLVREQEGVNALNEAFAEVAGILGKMGMEAEDIQNILSEPALAKEFIEDLKDGKLDAKLLRDYLNGIEKNKKIQIQINMATPEGIQTEFEKLYGQAQEAFRVRRDRVEDDFEDRIRAAQKNIDETRNKIEETQKAIDKIQTTINEKQRDIEINVTRPIEEFQNTISDLQRNIEINFDRPIAALQEESSDLANALTLMDREVSDINNKYDKQLEALDKILTINEQLAQEQQTQLDIADALSRGDIAAAARAAQELQAQQAQQRADASRQRIEQARELEIERLKTAQGLTRKQVEERQFEISQQIYALEEQREIVQTQILGIQDQIYILEQLREQKLAAIRVLEDQIYNIQTVRLAQLQIELADREAILAKIEEEKQSRLDAIALEEEAWNDVKLAFDEAMQRGKDYIQMLKDAIALLERLRALQEEKTGVPSDETNSGDSNNEVNKVTPEPSRGDTKIVPGSAPTGVALQTAKELNAAINASKARTDSINSAISSRATQIKALSSSPANASIVSALQKQNATDAYTKSWELKAQNAMQQKVNTLTSTTSTLQAKRIKLAAGGLVPYMRMGGMLPYKANGGLFKSINTDTVPAMLTPGEFVVRRFAVEKFGTENLKAINNGTYKGDSMYNYEVNVNVKSDANPDQIARAVMTQIKQIDSMRLKGNRF